MNIYTLHACSDNNYELPIDVRVKNVLIEATEILFCE